MSVLKSRHVYLSYEEHDTVTANTQAVTHAAFLSYVTGRYHEYDRLSYLLSMGTAWHSSEAYPWEHGVYVGGIETVKVNIMLRIYSNKWHVYAGLAILNPSARRQIHQYAQSATELYKLMVQGRREELRRRVFAAREKVFKDFTEDRAPILLSESILDQFSLSKLSASEDDEERQRKEQERANSHLAILAMVDCWAALGIHPFVHLDLAATPIFRMWIGVAEYLFRNESLLVGAINAAIDDVTYRADDTEFVVAARGWSQCVSFGNFSLYKERFEQTARFFEPRFAEAAKLGGQMIKAISAAPPASKS